MSAFDYPLFYGGNYVLHRDDGRYLYAEFLIRLLHGGEVGVQRLFLPVYADYHTRDVYLCGRFELGEHLSECLARSHYVLHENDFFAVFELFADEQAAFAVVLHLFSVEAVVEVFAVVVPERHRRGDSEGYALVGGADERFAVDAVIDDTFGVVFAEAGKLGARLVVARVYEVGRLSAAFEREFAER